MQIEEGFRDIKSMDYGLYLAKESRFQAERRVNLLQIAALITSALWLLSLSLKEKDSPPNGISGLKATPTFAVFGYLSWTDSLSLCFD
jgi:hypothetical protein